MRLDPRGSRSLTGVGYVPHGVLKGPDDGVKH